jgi:cation:H+ antiporter
VTPPLAVLAVAGGIALLTGGGELLVRGAVSLAQQLRVSTAVIGLTIVAIGTSMPEMSVSLLAAAGGQPDIAVGNVVGSNIFNIAAILGLAAAIRPLSVHMSAVRLEWPFMFVTMAVALVLARDGAVDRLEGAFLLVSFTVFTAFMVRIARREVSAKDADEIRAAVASFTPTVPVSRALRDVASVVAGGALLAGGARALITGGTTLAELVGISERVVGLTVAAVGTSLPELASSLIAARRGQADIALANVLGSNIFNVLGVLGTVSVITPQAVHRGIIASDLWWMVGTSLLLFPLMLTGRRIGRGEGIVLLAVYGVYLSTLR